MHRRIFLWQRIFVVLLSDSVLGMSLKWNLDLEKSNKEISCASRRVLLCASLLHNCFVLSADALKSSFERFDAISCATRRARSHSDIPRACAAVQNRTHGVTRSLFFFSPDLSGSAVRSVLIFRETYSHRILIRGARSVYFERLKSDSN